MKFFGAAFGLSVGITWGILTGVLIVDHIREWKKGAFEPVRIEVYPRWQMPDHTPTVERPA